MSPTVNRVNTINVALDVFGDGIGILNSGFTTNMVVGTGEIDDLGKSILPAIGMSDQRFDTPLKVVTGFLVIPLVQKVK